ncbi:hypothetical protein ABIC66_002537 [Caulobacter sp. 1776]
MDQTIVVLTNKQVTVLGHVDEVQEKLEDAWNYEPPKD